MLDFTIWVDLIPKIMLIIIPAYGTNAFAFLLGGKRPLDCGKNFFDGKRVFGDGKTIRGLIFGIFFGSLLGSLTTLVLNYMGLIEFNYYFFLFSFIIATGSILGDLTGAFIKRRMGLKRGAPLPGLDQLNFILLAAVFAYLFTLIIPIINITLLMLAVLLVVTPISHFISCIIAYKAGKKREPW